MILIASQTHDNKFSSDNFSLSPVDKVHKLSYSLLFCSKIFRENVNEIEATDIFSVKSCRWRK